MELRQLERFLAVIEHGSLAAAARQLDMTQQAISASIASLEGELGVRLLERTPGGITRPTDYGLAFIRHARAQLAGAERARQELRSMHDAEAGTVTIAVGESFAGDIIAGAISRWHRTRPNVRINLVEGYSEYLQQRLYDGEFDFIAAGVSTFQLADGFIREPIYSANDVIVVRSSHPLAGRRGLELVDLAGYTWLVPYSRQTDLSVIVEAFVAARLEPPRSVIGSDAYRIGMQLMFDNDWLLMVSPALIGAEPTSGRRALVTLAIDEPTVRRNASLVYSKTRPLTPQAASLLEEIRVAAGTEQRYERPESAAPGARRTAKRRR